MDTPFSLPTPPTLEQRLDAAIQDFRKRIWGDDTQHWEAASKLVRRMHLNNIEAICRAFAPEHFNPTPQSGEQGDAA